MSDAEIISTLEQIFTYLPHAVIVYGDDDCEEDRYGMIPMGWSLRVDGCQGLLTITGTNLRDVIEKFAKHEHSHE